MADTTFVTGTVIEAAWLNDVNEVVYNPAAAVIPASSIVNTPAGSIAATDVQTALNELDTEKQPKDALLTALAAQTTAADTIQAYSGVDTATLLTVGTASGNVPLVGAKSATESLAGLVELATVAECETGTATDVVATPAGVAAAIAAISAGTAAIIQVVSTTIAAATGTTTIPDDNTAPLSTEGTEIATLAITPASTSNTVKLSCSFSLDVGGDAAAVPIVSIFRGTTCIGAVRHPSTAQAGVISLDFIDAPSTISATTYSVRIGQSGSASWYVNRSAASATALASSMANSRFIAEELAA